jgi:THO complex subunit 2
MTLHGPCLLPGQEALKRLPEEKKAQEAHVRSVDKLLQRSLPTWRCDRRGMLVAYLQQCVLPRVRYSPADAAYCAKFTQRLHDMALPFFPTILYFDTVNARPLDPNSQSPPMP